MSLFAHPIRAIRKQAACLILCLLMLIPVSGTGLASTTPPGADFLTQSTSTDSAGLKIDAAGGMHLVGAGYYTGLNTSDDQSDPDYYAYCPPDAACSSIANWSIVKVANKAASMQIDLTPDGHPRLLLQIPDQNGYSTYWYGVCDANCTTAASWSFTGVVNTTNSDMGIYDRSKHFFALDPQGHPRFLYRNDVHQYYAYCDTGCTGSNNWYATQINDDGGHINLTQMALAFNSLGQPRVAAEVYDDQQFTWYVGYLECNSSCDQNANWTMTNLTKQGQYPSLVIRMDNNDVPHIAFFQDNYLWYAWRDGNGNWQAYYNFLNTGGGQDPDLQFDAQNLPHLSYLTQQWNLGYAWCSANCDAQQGSTWNTSIVDTSAQLAQDFPRQSDHPANCLDYGWWGGKRSSLALDPNGNPAIVYDAEHQYTCVGPDVRTEFVAVRLVIPPAASGTGGHPKLTKKVYLPLSLKAKANGW